MRCKDGRKVGEVGVTTREKAVLWLNSFVKNKETMTLIPNQLIRLMYDALKEQPEVVRCKDCKHFDLKDSRCFNKKSPCRERMTGTRWYCADGERRRSVNECYGL